MPLNFNDWESINEANVLDKIKNWFSSNFGGAIEKIEKILLEYKKTELSYFDEWEEINIEVDKLELEVQQTKSDPAELKKIDRLIKRNKNTLALANKNNTKKKESILAKISDVVKDNVRLNEYFKLSKIKLDAELTEEMYKKAKGLTDKSVADTLYGKYKDTVLSAKEKDLEFRKKYGSVIDSPPIYNTRRTTSNTSGSEPEFSYMINLELPEFRDAVKTLDKAEIKKLVSTLLKERDEKYVAMEIEHKALETKSPADAKILKARYMNEIKALRTKITIARSHA